MSLTEFGINHTTDDCSCSRVLILLGPCTTDNSYGRIAQFTTVIDSFRLVRGVVRDTMVSVRVPALIPLQWVV
ncbi:MAG: hypothetical protein IPO62_16605 [Saprospiraceae bacterium]|nr:hypothetical protein [Saprospiraceae bacterium]